MQLASTAEKESRQTFQQHILALGTHEQCNFFSPKGALGFENEN